MLKDSGVVVFDRLLDWGYTPSITVGNGAAAAGMLVAASAKVMLVDISVASLPKAPLH